MAISSDDFIKIVKGGKAEKSSTPITAENFAELLKATPKKEEMSWADVPLQAITNVPQSAVNFGHGLVEAVSHPLTTAKTVLDIGAGTLKNITPQHIADLIDQYDKHPETINKAVETANQVAQFYKERYGSSEGFKQALSQDPVGVASDVASVLSGGAGVASKVGAPAKIVGGLERAAELTNPITATTGLVKNIATPALGLTTGTGAENIANAAKAGVQGDQTFLQNLRNEVPITNALDAARHNLNVMKQNRSNKYRSGMVDVSNDKNVLSFDDINKELKNAKESISYKGKVKDDFAHEHISKLEEEIKDWEKENSDLYHTPEGLDALKQRIGAINQRVPYEETNASRVGNNIYNTIKKTIADQAPTYSNVMADYSLASDNIHEIERALSLGNRSSADTALRKLQSLTRNNVNTNYGNRLNLAQQLEAEGGKPFINALSGQALSSPTARGLAGMAESGAALGAISNPMYLAALPFQTPRLVGEGLYATGRASQGLQNIGSQVGLGAGGANTLADLLYAGQRNQQQEEQ